MALQSERSMLILDEAFIGEDFKPSTVQTVKLLLETDVNLL